MQPRLLLCLLSLFFFSLHSSAISTAVVVYPHNGFTDSTDSMVHTISAPKKEKVGFFKKIRNAVAGFVVKMHLKKASKKNSAATYGFISLVLLALGLLLAFTSSGSGHAIATSAYLAFAALLLAVVFAIVFLLVKRKNRS